MWSGLGITPEWKPEAEKKGRDQIPAQGIEFALLWTTLSKAVTHSSSMGLQPHPPVPTPHPPAPTLLQPLLHEAPAPAPHTSRGLGLGESLLSLPGRYGRRTDDTGGSPVCTTQKTVWLESYSLGLESWGRFSPETFYTYFCHSSDI